MKKIFILLIIILAVILRFFKAGENPPSLSWDEASLGYNAYTVATSLRDEHGEFLPRARFIAFGDYKPPGYIYAAILPVKLFGLSEFAVRLPSMISGVLMVIFTSLLVKELFGSNKLALLASFLFAVSPWSLHLSRAAYEANLGALFNLIGIYFFLLFLKKKWALLVSTVFFILSFYTFNANRIIAPLILIACLAIYWKYTFQNIKWVVLSVIIALLLLLPSYSYLLSRESRLRFQEVSIFNNLEPIKISNQRIDYDGNVWWSKILHNRRLSFASDFLKHYFDNFSGRFLFTNGDVNPRLAVTDMGQLYLWELPFLLTGIYLIIKLRSKNSFLVILWMLIVPIPAASARETPHALRIVSILPSYQIIIAYGLFQIINRLKEKISSVKNVAFIVLSLIFIINVYSYLHNYYIHYPPRWSGEWQYGYKQMVNYVSDIQDNYDQVFVTENLGRPYIYFIFYEKYPLNKFINERVATRDWYGFWNVSQLGKIKFGFKDLNETKGRILLVTTPDNLPGGYRLLNTIKNLSGSEVFLIAEKHEI